MDIGHRFFSPIVIGLLALATLSSAVESPRPNSLPAAIQVDGAEAASALSAAEHELVEFGLERFEGQGLDLPEIRIQFYPSATDCHGHKGYYSGESVVMCSLDRKVMLHELAHAWVSTNLTTTEMEQFVRFVGLDSWNDQTDPWEERGTEYAAEVIAWALLDRQSTIRFLEESADGSVRPVFRLLTIKDSSPEGLYRGFLELTGMEPRFRSATEWDSEALEAEWQLHMGSVRSPEANRVTG